MKTLLLLSAILIALVAQPAHAQKTRTLFYDDILYGKVKQTIAIESLPKTIVPEIIDTTWYDEKGNTLEDHRKTSHGTIFKEKYIDKTDASGKKIEIVAGQRDQIITAKFDAKGNMTEYSSVYKTGGTAFSSFYEYDDRNNLKNYKSFDKNNNLTLKKTYKYDDKDRLISEDHLNNAGNLEYRIDFAYEGVDKQGNWTKRTSQKTFKTGQPVNDIAIIRQIIYYQ